jgi:hypothetical protein
MESLPDFRPVLDDFSLVTTNWYSLHARNSSVVNELDLNVHGSLPPLKVVSQAVDISLK